MRKQRKDGQDEREEYRELCGIELDGEGKER